MKSDHLKAQCPFRVKQQCSNKIKGDQLYILQSVTQIINYSHNYSDLSDKYE